jgi:hypothetical protein
MICATDMRGLRLPNGSWNTTCICRATAASALVEAIKGGALKADAALGIEQAQDRLAQGGFARAGFADDAQGLAALHAQADAVHRRR